MNILEELADFELVCCSGDGGTIKVKDVGVLVLNYDNSLPEGACFAHANRGSSCPVYFIIIGTTKDFGKRIRKDDPEFEEVFGNFLITRFLR